MSARSAALTSADIARCSRSSHCQATMDCPWRSGPPVMDCAASDCGRPLNEHFLASAAKTIATWRTRRWARGDMLTLGMMIDEVVDRWPLLSREHARQVISAADRPRSER